jgi:hypothetical protein
MALSFRRGKKQLHLRRGQIVGIASRATWMAFLFPCGALQIRQRRPCGVHAPEDITTLLITL